MTTTIKITELTDIGANLASSTVLPVVNMSGTPTTQKTVMANIANLVLAGAGGNYVTAAKATTANTVTTNAQPNITSIGNLTGLTVSNATGVVNFSNTANVTLGAVANLHITGGSNGQTLTTNGSGNLSWTTVSGGNGIPSGTNTQIQFNDVGAFGGNTGFTFDKTTGVFATPFANVSGVANIVGGGATVATKSVLNVDSTFGSNSSSDPASAQAIRGRVTGSNLTQTRNYVTGVTGQYLVTGTNASEFIKAGVLGVVGDQTTTADGAVVAYLDGDGGLTTANAAYAVSMKNSTPNSGFNYGLDLQFISLNLGGVTTSKFKQADIRFNNGVTLVANTAGNISINANVTVGNIIATNIGNIANINLTGNSSNVLYGNGVFASIPTGANTGNVTFNDVNIIGTGNLNLQPDPANSGSYLDIFLSSGPDIHIVASANANLILGKDNQSNVMTSWDGNVYIQSWDNNTNTQGGVWTFDGTGNLGLPGGGIIYGNPYTPSGAPGNTITLQPAGSGITTNQKLMIYPTAGDGDHIHMTSGNLYETELFLGSDNLYVKLANTGNVVINSNDSNGNSAMWTFGTDGSTIFPTLTTQRGDNPSDTITGQTLLFGDNAQEAIISTPDGVAGINGDSSQRLVINPGEGYQGGEGGDIYLWAGRGGNASGSGGDIKIRGGQGGSNTVGGTGGAGGYIRIEAGDAATTGGAPGYIDITGGYSNTVGGYVNVTGGQGNVTGGVAKIYGGYGTATGGNVDIWGGASGNGQINEGSVNIQTGGKTWTYDTSGNLSVPGDLIGPASANFTIYANAGVHDFIFAQDGTFYAPDNVVLGGNSIYIGPGANTLTGLEHAVMIASSNHFPYIQAVINNVSDNGSADWVAQGHFGDDTGGWADMGFTSGGFGDANYTITGPGDGYLFVESYAPGQLITGPKGGNLILATGSQGTTKDIIFGTGGFLTGNIFGRISHANNSFELSRAGATITFPDATKQNTAWTGNVARIANGNSNVNIATANGNVTIAAVGNTTMTITGTGANITGTANISGNVNTAGQLSATGNITTSGNFVGNGAALTNVTVNVAGNIVGTQSNVTLVAGAYSTVFDNTGVATFPGNISTSGSFVGNGASLSNVATKTTGSWTLAPGVNSVDINVPLNGTYSIWVNGNIPNGIITYTATAVVTNNNVPVLGSSYGWYYAAGNALVLTSIPTQFVGTVNNISNAVVTTTTANVFTFGITNNSGSSQVVNWGYTKL
jgi:hypothetical protein